MKKLLKKAGVYISLIIEAVCEAMEDENRHGGSNDFWYYGN